MDEQLPFSDQQRAERQRRLSANQWTAIGVVGVLTAGISVLLLVVMTPRASAPPEQPRSEMLTSCPACGHPLAKIADHCTHCGYSPALAAKLEREQREAAEARRQAERDRDIAAERAANEAARLARQAEQDREYGKLIAATDAKRKARLAAAEAARQKAEEATALAEATERGDFAETLPEILEMPNPDYRTARLAEHFGGSANLQYGKITAIRLENVKLGDGTLQKFPIGELTALLDLDLRNTFVGDAGVDWLAELPRTAKLASLRLDGSRVTRKRLEKLWLAFRTSDFVSNDSAARQYVLSQEPAVGRAGTK